jgi:HD-like signal output (HDOD) protein
MSAAGKPPPKKPPSGAPVSGSAGKIPPSVAGGDSVKNVTPGAPGGAAAAPTPDVDALSVLGAAKTQEPEVFRTYIEKIHSRIKLPQMSRAIISEFATPDVTSERVAECIRRNPYYQAQFLQYIGSISKREEMPELSAAIVLVGMQNSRNLILALQLNRTVKGTHPEWTKEGKLALSPKDALKFALKTEEAVAGNRDAYPDIAYAAGMLFDMLNMIATHLAPENKKIPGYIESAFNHGLRTAKVGLELSKKMPDLVLKKYAFAACLIHDIGKIPLAILEAKYTDFLEDAQKREMTRAIRQFAEQKTFGVTHQMLGALICEQYSMFRPISKAILCHHDPYLLKESNKSLYQIAALVALSTNIASSFKKIDKPEDPLIAKWKGPEVADFKVDAAQIIAAVGQVTV